MKLAPRHSPPVLIDRGCVPEPSLYVCNMQCALHPILHPIQDVDTTALHLNMFAHISQHYISHSSHCCVHKGLEFGAGTP